MKILAVSDRVVGNLYHPQVREAHSDVDLIIGCGDLPFYYLEFLVSALDVPLVYVRGNHDNVPQYTVDGRALRRVPGGLDLHGRIVTLHGLTLAGLEGSIRYRPDDPLMYTEAEMRWEIARLLPHLLWRRFRRGRGLDILVTHSPPFQIHDRPDRAHTGFRLFHRFMTLFRPRYLLHGHIHIYRRDVPRITRFADTIVINVYPFYFLDPARPPRVQAVYPA